MTRKLTCHCGAVELAIEGEIDFSGAYRCTCSFCSRRGAVAVRVPKENVAVVRGADNLTLYTWNTGTAQHHFCKTCGIYTHHRTRSNPELMGVNVAALEGVRIEDVDSGWIDGRNHPSDRA